MTDVFARYGLRRVINVSGTETEWGGTPVCPEVTAAVTELIPNSVNMAELQSAACHTISRAMGSEAGCVTGCTAGSVSICVGAAMAGSNLSLAEQLPDVLGMKSEVVMQKGHEVTYGQSVSQNIRLAGARIVEIGAATQCSAYQLRSSLTEKTAAAFYVVSHLTVQSKLIELKEFVDICHQADVPVIVDAASQPNPQDYIAAGADLVLFSAQKAFGSLTAGIIAGRLELVRACIYQAYGIGRPMKPGKEAVIGVIAALERWMNTDRNEQARIINDRMVRAVDTLNQIGCLTASIDGSQLVLRIPGSNGPCTAHQLAQALLAQTPSILVWDHLSASGELRMTFKLIADDVADHVCASIAAAVNAKNIPTYEEVPVDIGDRMLAGLERWPLDCSV